jgi:hypothetical protein
MNRLVIGSPDKTAFLLQCMQEDFDRGFTLIDPTGTLAKAIANRLPAKRIQDRAVYLDPADIEHPFGLNVLDGVLEDDRHKVASDIRIFFDNMFPEGRDTLSRAQSNFLLTSCIRILLDTPGNTLLGVLKLLQDPNYPKFQEACLANSNDPIVARNWAVINSWAPAHYEAAIAPLQSKMSELLMSPIVRNILGQKHSTFSMEPGNIVIANLDRSKLGDQTAYLLGSLLISRAKGPVYINDLGFFASDHLAALFQQDRFTVSLQFLDELPKKLQQPVLAIPDKTVFKTTMEDAERLAFYVGVTNPAILTDLSPSEARGIHGVTEPTIPPSAKRLEAIRRRSRACYTRPRKAVEKAIDRYFAA